MYRLCTDNPNQPLPEIINQLLHIIQISSHMNYKGDNYVCDMHVCLCVYVLILFLGNIGSYRGSKWNWLELEFKAHYDFYLFLDKPPPYKQLLSRQYFKSDLSYMYFLIDLLRASTQKN